MLFCGHAYAQGYFMHGNSPEKYCLKDVARILLWSLIIPVIVLLLTIFVSPWLLSLLLIYPAKILQIAKNQVKHLGFGAGFAYSASLVLCKFPQLKGMCSFLIKYITGQNFKIIEYKGTAGS